MTAIKFITLFPLIPFGNEHKNVSPKIQLRAE